MRFAKEIGPHGQQLKAGAAMRWGDVALCPRGRRVKVRVGVLPFYCGKENRKGLQVRSIASRTRFESNYANQ